jgi:hypothetical protein
VGNAGLERIAKSPRNEHTEGKGGAQSGAVGGDLATLAGSDFVRLIAVWPSLPDRVRVEILASVDGAAN